MLPPLPLTRLPLLSKTLTTTTTTATAAAAAPPDPALLLRLCTVLYQQQDSPDPKLKSHLDKLHLVPSHELFLQVCNRFPLSWKPVHRFHLHLRRHHHFSHTPTTLNKILDIAGKSRNIQLLWDLLHEIDHQLIITPRTLQIAAASLAAAREINKCAAAILHLDPSIDTLNRVVETLSARRLTDVAKAVVSKLEPTIAPNETTYRHLITGFCRSGDLVESTKIWNKMVNHGFNPDLEASEELLTTLFKSNSFEDAMNLFKFMRHSRFSDLGTQSYKIPISWLCNQGRIDDACMVFGEMLKRGFGVDNQTLGALVYGLLVRRRVREGYRVVASADEPDIGLYHGLIKGLLRLKRPADATRVFREMVERGCEPIMHTYIMLLQGHLGKRGRKGRDYPLVNFESVFVGGLVKVGRALEATKYVERMMSGGGRVEVPRFDYNRFLHCFSDEEGVAMFEGAGRRMREMGLVDLGDIFLRYGERMATRERRRRARIESNATMLKD